MCGGVLVCVSVCVCVRACVRVCVCVRACMCTGKLSQSSSELLLSFLTVPYIRIPLVINFFASPENLNALSNPDMQV